MYYDALCMAKLLLFLVLRVIDKFKKNFLSCLFGRGESETNSAPLSEKSFLTFESMTFFLLGVAIIQQLALKARN